MMIRRPVVARPISSDGGQRQPHLCLAPGTSHAVERRVVLGWKLERIVGTNSHVSGFPRVYQKVVEIQPFSTFSGWQEVASWLLEPTLRERL